MMIDLDAPGGLKDQSYSPLLHWAASIPAGVSSIAYNDSSATMAFAPYIGPAPTAGDGPHRYVIMAWSSPGAEFTVPQAYKNYTFADITQRVKFNVTKFAEAGGLTTLAANWYTTEALPATPSGSPTPVPTGAGCKRTGGAAIVSAAAFLFAAAMYV